MGYNKNTNEMEAGGSGSYNNLYDPDREYQQRLLAYEMYGPQGVTGYDYNYYNPYQTGNAKSPHWNYVNNPDGPPEGRIGAPPGGIGTGGGTPNEVPNTDVPTDRGDGGRKPQVVGPRGGPPTGGGSTGQPPDRTVPPRGGGGTQGPPRGGTQKSSQKVSTVPGGPGTADNPAPNPNRDPNDPWDIGDPYAGDVPGNAGDYYSNGPTGPGHATWINQGQSGVSGPMVRPADRNSNAIYAGPFNDWNEGGASGNTQIAGGKLYDTFSDLLAHPDLPDNVKSAIVTGANEGANAQYDSANGMLSRYGRTTGNRAGNAAAVAALGKSKADTAANTNRQVQLDFENEKTKRRQEGETGMGSLYNTEGNKLLAMFGARGNLSNKPLAGNTTQSSHGLNVGNGFNFGIG